ncbi:MAG: sugar ABC transporter permease [candidate division KSB1 bacterium]|nr:sugar ABC transporter permease [candidate division KSB1 bacterium]MDZ7312330.1 sugar ABC transporter permease [candidate division KSB1 bacterium]
MLKRTTRQTITAYSFLSPVLIFYSIVLIFPIGFSAYLAFHRWNMLTPPASARYVGFSHFVYLLTMDDLFRAALGNTVVFALGTVFVGMIVALLIALAINRMKSAPIWRFLFFIPMVITPVAIGIIWKYLYEPVYGLINTVLRLLHLPAQPWLSSAEQALPSIMLVSIWATLGGMIIIFEAGLKNIPEMYYDQAKIDGANPWQQFRRITLPLLKPTITFILVTGMISAWQIFDLVFVMTRGATIAGGSAGSAPLESTIVVALHIYQTAFEYLRMGRASAMAFVLFFVILVITLIQLRLLRKGGIEEI